MHRYLISVWLLVLTAPTVIAAGPPSPIAFRDVTRQAGLIEPLSGMLGHGGAWGDVDGDGTPDLFVGGFGDRPNAEYRPASGPVANRLLRNLDGGRFARVHPSPVETYGRTSGAIFADLDNNGTNELYVANNASADASATQEPQHAAQQQPCQLFRNDGGRLVDISSASGACPPGLHKARNVGLLDFDGDGLLDLLVIEDRFTPRPRSVLLHNLGQLRFEDANRRAGLPEDVYGFGGAIADVNNDGQPDFFIPLSNRFFLSGPGGKYREPESLRALFAWKPLDSEDWPCGAAWGALHRAGLLDLVLTMHHAPARNRVYLNVGLRDGVPQFRDVTEQAGLGQAVPVRCPHVEIQDFDNDGWPDIYTSAAWLEGDGQVVPLVFRHAGLRDRVPQFTAPRPLRSPMVYYPAGPSADYDRDGRLDLFLVNWFPSNHCRLLRNESPPRHWLQVQVVGRRANRMGIGAQVRIFRAGGLGKPSELLGFQEIAVGFGYASGQLAVCHFGLGETRHVDLQVRLPNAVVIAKSAVAANQLLVIEEPTNAQP